MYGGMSSSSVWVMRIVYAGNKGKARGWGGRVKGERV